MHAASSRDQFDQCENIDPRRYSIDPEKAIVAVIITTITIRIDR